MSFTLLFVLAAAVSMDAFAVAISNGMCCRRMGKKQALIMALTFGGFQGAMPVAGYFGGRLAEELISSLDHWIALILLSFIGGSMILESLREMRAPEECGAGRFLSAKELAVQGVATSIDALAVGISLAALKINIVTSAALIGAVTFFVCLFGAVLGKRFGLLLGQKAKIAGGAILIGIGVKIFVEHQFG